MTDRKMIQTPETPAARGWRVKRRHFCGLCAGGAAATVAACTVNPATGRNTFTGLMSPAEEKRIGAEQHPKIIEEFGGEYGSAELRAYVTNIGNQLAARTETAGQIDYTFTVLNSDVVNAFALPGGYVYITRGLMALADDEAQLAGVIGHEIGHVVARHSAERYSKSVLANVGAALLGVAFGGGAAELGAGIAGVAIQSYSRDQEFEADILGIRYATRTGYTPDGMPGFLEKLRQDSILQAKIAGRNPNEVDETNIMATHPRTADRVARAIQAAQVKQVPNARVGRADYLLQIDGLLYGDDPAQGVIRGRRFLHPDLAFVFEVPQGFNLINGASSVTAVGPNRSQIVFDMHPGDVPTVAMTDYITRYWAQKIQVSGIQNIQVNGLRAATGVFRQQTSIGNVDVRLVAIRGNDNRIFRFVFLTPVAMTAQLDEGLRRTTYSFRRLSASEAEKVRPLRLRIIRAGGNDSFSSLASSLPFESYRAERFATLNGIPEGANIQPGDRLKTVSY
jgi:predicted Zn-dependent protease